MVDMYGASHEMRMFRREETKTREREREKRGRVRES